MRAKKVFWCVGCGLLAVSTAAYAVSTSTKKTQNCSISSTGVHKCNKGAPEESNGNDPRAETFVPAGVDPDNSNDYFKFEANYYITNAKRTTIMQFLNDDPSKSDRYKPVVFLTATKKSNGNYFICNGNSTSPSSCSGAEWDNVPASFILKAERNGTNVDVTISGTKKTLSLITTPSGQSRSGGETDLRFGVYQHDLDSAGKSTITAQVRVYNTKYNSF